MDSGRKTARRAGRVAARGTARGIRLLSRHPIAFGVILAVTALLAIVIIAAAAIGNEQSTAAALYLYETETELGEYSEYSAALPLSEEVQAYRERVYEEAAKYGKEEYTDLFLAVMQRESGGRVTDVFQCSESLGLSRNSITTEQSIEQGVKLLCGYLDSAGVESVYDISHIRLALQGYNYGNGYISWALDRDGGWTQNNANKFAEEQHEKNPSAYPLRTGSQADSLGEWGYGDQYYTSHVLMYYSYTSVTRIAGDGAGVDVANYALQFVGNPYVWGGTSLTEGCDCSGFVMGVYAYFGVALPHSSVSQRSVGIAVEWDDMIPGDIVCFNANSNGISHVGIYIGNGQMVHASNAMAYPRGGIKVSDITPSYHNGVAAIRRIFI